jgi:hypothetical protein
MPAGRTRNIWEYYYPIEILNDKDEHEFTGTL